MHSLPFDDISQYEKHVEQAINNIQPKTPEEISVLFAALSAIYHNKQTLPSIALRSSLRDRVIKLQELCNPPLTSPASTDFKQAALAQVKKKMEEIKNLHKREKSAYIEKTQCPPRCPYSCKEIESLFALVNLGSIELDMTKSDLFCSSTVNSTFMTEILETIVEEPDLPSEDRIALTGLVKQYKRSAQIAARIQQLQNIKDPEQLLQAKENLISFIYQALETDGTLYLPSGFAAEPAGHAVMIKLTLDRDVVFAEIINRGLGAERHGIIDTKGSKVFSTINLPGVFLQNLKNSKFLSSVLNLKILEALQYRGDPSPCKKTSYSIEEFYDTALLQWPSAMDAYTIEESLRGSQRGDTCSLKQYISPIRSIVSRDTERKIKLHMRMRSLELFLELTAHNQYSIHQIEWAQAKISKSCNAHKCFSEKDRQEAIALLQKADEKIASIKKQLLIEASSKIPDFSEPPEHFEIPSIEIFENPSIIYKPASSITQADPKVTLSQLQYTYDSLYSSQRFMADQLRPKEETTAIILNYLKSLPLATDPIWTSEILDNAGLGYHYITYIRRFIQIFCKEKIPTGDEVALMANAIAGALQKAASKNEDQVFISQQASTLLYLLTQSKKQFRIKDPEKKKFLEAAIKALQALYHEEDILPIENCVRNITKMDFGRGDLVLTFPSMSYRHIHNTPFLEQVYRDIEQFKERTKGPVSESLIERSHNPSFRGVFCHILDLSEFNDSTERVPLEECTFKFIHHNGCTLHFPMTLSKSRTVSSHAATFSLGAINDLVAILSGFSNAGIALETSHNGSKKPTSKELSYTHVFYTPILSGELGCELVFKTQRDPKFQSSQVLNGGVLCSGIYAFQEKDKLFFIPCLDDRLLPESENGRIETCYNADSQTNLPSMSLSREEQILLKSIGLYDELTIPLWIYYLQEHFQRLESPLFGALTEAFLTNRVGFARAATQNPSWIEWTSSLLTGKRSIVTAPENIQDSWGDSVLSVALQDPHSQVAENLLDFLETHLNAIESISTLDQTKSALLRTLAISYKEASYLHSKTPGNNFLYRRLKRIETILSTHISADFSTSPLLQATVVSLYPYIKNHSEFVRTCRSVLAKMKYEEELIKEQSYSFHQDFKEGVQALQTHSFPPDHLPIFVFEEISYLLTDKAPRVHLDGNVYSFMDGGVPTQVVITSPTTYVLKKQWPDHTGTLKWYSHHKTPDSFLSSPPPVLASHGYLAKQPLDYWVHKEGCHSEALIFPLGVFSPPAYYIRNGQLIKGDHLDLSLVPLTGSDWKDLLLQRVLFLENAQAILAWKDPSHQIVLIEFPDYGFQLQREQKGPSQEIRWKFIHPNYPNTYLDFSRPCMELEPYSHYLPLIDTRGRKTIVIPNQTFSSQQVGFSGEETPKGVKSNSPQLLRIEISPQGELILPLEAKPLLSLFFLAMHIKDYARAETILKHLMLNRTQWSDEEASIITDHFQSCRYPKEFDRSPYACRLRIKLLCLQEKLGVPLTTEQTDILLGDYDICSKQKTQGILLDVSPDEEFILEKYINQAIPKQSIFYPMLSKIPDLPIIRELGFATFKMLQQIEPHLISYGLLALSSPSRVKDNASYRTFKEGYVYSLAQNFKTYAALLQSHIDSPEPVHLETRPFLFINFLHYYKIATQGTREEKRELKKLLELCRYAQLEALNKLCYDILLSVLHMNESSFLGYSFPRVNEVISERGLYQLLRDMENFYKNHPLPSFQKFPQLYASKPQRPEKTSPLAITSDAEDAFLPEDFSLQDSCTALASIQGSLLRKNENIENLENSIANLTKKMENLSLSKEKRKSRRMHQLQDQVATYEKQLEQLSNREKIGRCRELASLYSFPSEEPSIISSCETTQNGIEQFIANLETSHEKSVRSINRLEINHVLDESIQQLSSSVEAKKTEIETLLSSYPTEQLQFQLKMKLIKPITLKEALVFFAQQEDLKILESNPSLAGSLNAFKELIATYLKEKTEMQHLLRVKRLFLETNHASNPQEAVVSYRKFLDAVNAPRAYDVDTPDFQALLVFEELNDLRLRTEQVQALISMTSEESSNIELEARTGFGKSQVLIPLWLFLKSRTQKVVTIMVVPASLLSDQERHLQRLLGKPLSTGIHKITFSRDKATDLEALKKLHVDLSDAIKYKRIILTNIGSLHGMTSLALKDALFKESTHPSANGRALIQELQAIRKIIKSQSSVFIDESRECLAPRQRYDYAIGNPILVDPSLCHNMLVFWGRYFFDPLVQNKWNFEFLPFSGRKELTENHFEELQQDLATLVAADIFSDASEQLQQDCIAHLKGGEATPLLKREIENLYEEQRKQYALCHSQISIHLKKTLMNTCGERYDLDPERIAYPLKAGVPQPTSEFATLDDLINFTIQANLKRDLEEDAVQSYIKSLQIESLKNAEFDTSPAYILFQKLQEKLRLRDLEQIQIEDIRKITQFLNEDLRETKLAFIVLWIIPKITTVPGKISGTSFNLFLHIDKVHGASGTTDPDALHPKMTASSNPAAPIGNLLSIYEHSKIQLVPEDPKEALATLLRDPNYSENSPPIIIDVGGSFLDLNDEEILSLFFANNPHIEAVSYYDMEGKHQLRMRGSKISIPRELSSLDINKIGIFIKEGSAIGSDTPMPIVAHGKLTIKHTTAESFFLQGAGRMRGLTQGQTLNIVLTEKECRTMTSEEALTIPALFKHLKIQEGKQKGLDYFFSLKLYLETLIEEPLWEVEETDELLRRFRLMQDLIVSSTLTDSIKTLYQTRTILRADEAVRLLKESLLKPLKEKNLPFIDVSRIERAFDAQVKYDKLLSMLPGGDNEIQESITEADQETTQEITQETIVDNTREKEVITFQVLPPISWTGDYTAEFSQEPSEELCSCYVYFSPNFHRLSSSSIALHKASYFYLVQIDPSGRKKVMALDLHDAHKALLHMKQQEKKRQGQTKTYLISHKAILSSDDATAFSAIEDLFPPSRKNEICEITILNKILRGSNKLSKNEMDYLKKQNVQNLENVLRFINVYKNYWPELEKLCIYINKILISRV